MKEKLKKVEINQIVFGAIIVVFVAVVGWFGWNMMETPENRGLDGEAIFRAAEKKAKANGVDLRTVPQWAGVYYKYHPEQKPGSVPVQSIGPPKTDPSDVTAKPTDAPSP
jgi:hypothetical protein